MREYTIETPSGEITVQLSDEDAKERGLKAKAEPKAKAAANKAATPANKAVEAEEPRTAAQKRADVAKKGWGKKPAAKKT
jgi:hypothetical protein